MTQEQPITIPQIKEADAMDLGWYDETSAELELRHLEELKQLVTRAISQAEARGEQRGRRFYIDCEFDGHGGEMLSMALVREDGRGLYLCIADEPDLLEPWVQQNVWPLVHLRLPVGRTVAFVEDWGDLIRQFMGPYGNPVIVADSPVDIWRFCEAVSTGADGEWHSTDWPRITFEVHNVECYPTTLPGAVQHNAWWDAMALRAVLTPKDQPND